jgi:hypothetical protein
VQEGVSGDETDLASVTKSKDVNLGAPREVAGLLLELA